MPPPASPPQSNTGRSSTQNNTEPYYSNEDVAILHDIVVLAEAQLPTLPDRERLPTNALFTAYDDILPRIGVNADYDSRYARILFRIGGLRSPGTLYEKFEEILARMGIEIEIETDKDEDHDATSSLEVLPNVIADASTSNTPREETQGHPERRRRRSEGTRWDMGTEPQFRTQNRRYSHSGASRFSQHLDRIPDFLPELSQTQPSPTKETEERHHTEDSIISDVKPRLNPQNGWNRARSLSNHGSFRIRRQSASVAPSHQISQNEWFLASENFRAEPSEATAITSYGEENPGRRSEESYNDFAFNQRSPALLEIKASLILQHHVSFFAKQQIRLWKEKALQIREDSHGLELIAFNRDKKVLLRGAVVDWRTRLRAKRASQETEGFFTHLEARATKARDVYLIHIAFTHWSACASEEVQRTALARRHIIRTKVFNAWREITAVNELKVRRQVLKKFFGVWKTANTSRANHFHSAIQNYKGKLLERIYTDWIEKHRTIRATNWLNEGIKRRILFRWIVRSHNSWEQRQTADVKQRLQLVQGTWSIWRAKTNGHIQQCQVAEAFSLAQLCRKPFRRWRQETQLVPARNLVQRDVSSRVIRGVFEAWLLQCRQEKQASNFDRMKILREAWTNWQYKSRIQIIATRADARITSESIYKWVVAARILALKRRIEGRVKHEMLGCWSSRAQVSQVRRLDHDDEGRSIFVHKRCTTLLATWGSRLGHLRQLENAASDFFVSRILRGKISQWRERAQTLQRLQRWSADASFYFLASKTLEQWKSSTESAKREKRKAAYTQIRRMMKMNLVRRVLQNWQRQAREVMNLDSQSQQVNYNKTVIMGMNTFDRWRGRVEEIAEMETSCREMTLRKHHKIWKERAITLQQLENEAVTAHHERQQSRAVKKWSLRSLQFRAQSNYALDIHEKNAKKTFRKILAYWHQKAVQKRPSTKPEQLQLGDIVRPGTWSDVGEDLEIDDWVKGLDEPPVSVTVPGYLSTPSKRIERAKSIATRFSTTPRMPLSSPFERQLRAQYSEVGLPSSRRPYTRSTLRPLRGFADVPEKETGDGQ